MADTSEGAFLFPAMSIANKVKKSARGLGYRLLISTRVTSPCEMFGLRD